MTNNFRFLFLLILFAANLTAQTDFVTLEGKQFKLNGKDFYPVSMNYKVDIVINHHDSIYLSPHHGYNTIYGYTCTTKQECFNEIVRDLKQIKSMGFNSIRLIGLAYGIVIDWDGSTSIYPSYIANSKIFLNNKLIKIENGNIYKHISQALEAADSAGLKVQLLVGAHKIDSTYYRRDFSAYLAETAAHFKNNSTLYSYDFMNEPLYFGVENNSKSEICELVKDWHFAIKNNSKYHLTTIGLVNSDEVFEWDPGVMKLDFLSFHIYEKNLDIFKSEVKWISETTKLPWMIGETGFRANDDDTSGISSYFDGDEKKQKEYVEATMEAVKNCGGSGYTWWMFKDITYSVPEYYGMVTRDGSRLKLAWKAFKNFNPDSLSSNCAYPLNYYNLRGQKNLNYTGAVINQNGEPIKNAVIKTWDKNGLNYTKTYSKPDGRFFVYSTSDVAHVQISAVGASIFKGKYSPTFQYIKLRENKFYPKNCSFDAVSLAEEKIQKKAISVFPNPSHNQLNIVSINNVPMQQVKLYNNVGQIVYQAKPLKSLLRLNLSNYPKGIYYLKILIEENTVSKRVIFN